MILLSSGEMHRIGGYENWYALSIFGRLNISIPAVSKSVLRLFDLNCIIPTIYTLVVLIKMRTLKSKKTFKFIFTSSLIIFSLTSCLNLFNYSYFLLAIILFLSELYIHIVEKQYEIIPIQFGFYAISFSMIITPLYHSQRPDLLLYMYFILIISKFTIELLKYNYQKVIFVSFLSFMFAFTLLYEVQIYYNIGSVHKERLKQINEFREGNSETLYLTKIPDEYTSYHQDCNVVDEDFWTYRWFLWYYDLPEGTKIDYID